MIAIVVGTRPEIIKLSPVIRELVSLNIDFFIVHTNQHYSQNMDDIFLRELNLPVPKYNLNIRETLHGKMTAKMLEGIESILINESPDWIIVQGDTNTVLAGTLAASKLRIKIAHVEAGLRSYDRTMPEEINRVVADHLSDALFCPTSTQEKILKGEGVSSEKIYLTGNTIVDAVMQNLELAKSTEQSKKYVSQRYFLLTMHRPSNVDDPKSLKANIDNLEKLATELSTQIIFPIHPRTKVALRKFMITPNSERITIIEPVGYLEMLLLMKSAQLILTDSGGIQEEACIMQVPCVTIRENTERPETVEVGANVVVGNSYENLLGGAKKMLDTNRSWNNPLGNGSSAKEIVRIISINI